MSRKYLASLALAASLILTIGILLRDRLLRVAQPPPVPPSEASALQQLSQEGQLRRLSDYLSERVAAVSPLVVYVASAEASGIRWGTGDTILTTLPGQPVVAIHRGTDSTRSPSAIAATDSARREWVLVVGRTPGGAVLSAAGILGGTTVARCGDLRLTEYVVSAALHDGFAGAGLFDLAGRTQGMVVRCDDRPAAIPIREVARVLRDTLATGTRVWNLFGMAVSPLDSRARDYFRSDSGLLVMAVRRDTPADDAGFRPGDVLLAIDERPVVTAADLSALGTGASASHVVRRRRVTAVSDVRLVRGDSSMADSAAVDDPGIEVADPAPTSGVTIGAVRAGSAAAAAGLRRGDRLLRVGTRDITNATVARRLLEQALQRETFVVYERDSVLRGVLLSR